MGHVLALCGGVGGAKLAFGLTRILAPSDLTIAVNVGDDFEHLGLCISPDIDTVVYTLADLSDRQRGWGLAGETWQFMETLRRLGGEGWFQLGDRDLAMHVERTRRLRAGETLSTVTRALSARLGVDHPIVPVSNDPVRTMLDCETGCLTFQEYFVREKCEPAVARIDYQGANRARLAPDVAAALARADLSAIVICTSNPYLSIAPMLAIPALHDGLAARRVPSVAVSPLVGGRAIKGPTTKLMRELGVSPTNATIAEYYAGLIDGLLIDTTDEADLTSLAAGGLSCGATRTVMENDEHRVALANDTLALARKIAAARAAAA